MLSIDSDNHIIEGFKNRVERTETSVASEVKDELYPQPHKLVPLRILPIWITYISNHSFPLSSPISSVPVGIISFINRIPWTNKESIRNTGQIRNHVYGVYKTHTTKKQNKTNKQTNPQPNKKQKRH